MLRGLRAGRAARAVGGMAVLALAGAGWWWFALRDDAAAAQAGVTTQTVAASLTTLEKSVSGSGTIAPAVHEELAFDAAGTVTSVAVQEGQTVTAGQALATIDTLALTANLLEAKATLATGVARLASARDADDGTDAATAQVAAAAAQVELAQAAVDQATAAMADATLVASVAGLVTDVNLTVGQVVGSSSGASGAGSSGASNAGASSAGASSGTTSTATTGTAQVVIVGTNSWLVDATVDDSEVGLISVGDQVELTLKDATDTVFGVVGTIGLISTSTGGVPTYPVTITITGQPAGVYDGVDADVAIVYERRTDVLTVPSAAVRTVDGASVVTQAGADGAEVTTPVTVGETVGGRTEITGGLAEGDEVLVTVVPTSKQGTGQNGGSQLPFDPSQFQLPDGFDPSQLPGGGQRPGGQGQGGTNG